MASRRHRRDRRRGTLRHRRLRGARRCAGVEDIADDYSDRAASVHVEIWHDIDERRFNDAVEDWIVTDDGGNEPWVFLVAADGTIAARWDNVLDADDLTARLRALSAA